MLIRYKKNQEKIAMGLLSFMLAEKAKIKDLQETIKDYENNPDRRLYLWKEEEDIVGAIGLKIEDELNVVIQHISVNPSHRNMGIGMKMIEAVKQLYDEKYDVCANKEVESFYVKYKERSNNDSEA